MNKRIQELAEQARASVPHGLVVSEWIDTYNHVFAQLIVGECASVCENSNYEFGTIFTKMIKEHFGVE